MRIDLGAKPNMVPLPVLIIGTYDENGQANAMNAAWGAVTDYDEISISMSEHKTTGNLAKTNALTISMGTASAVAACDYVGMVSGVKVPDKVEKAGLHPIKSSKVNAPLFKELPLALECEVKDFIDGILRVRIISINADESILTDGKVDLEKLMPISFDPFNNEYVTFTNKVAKAFSVGEELK